MKKSDSKKYINEIKKIKTHIDGFDEISRGGIPEHRSTLIAGSSGSGKTILARNIQRDFKLSFINLNDFYRDDFNEVVDLGNNIKVVDWDNPDSIDWYKFNTKVNLNKS